MGCNCGSKNAGNKAQYEVVENGRRVFGPTPYKVTAESVAARTPGRTVREVPKAGA
ncbi:hypothetical protein [Streptomyces sp. AGS-58]|uniref:hypothetical protein n=1 Tax=unclassified Streptomyces TaxID=2593676 RepID=UPI0035A29DAF